MGNKKILPIMSPIYSYTAIAIFAIALTTLPRPAAAIPHPAPEPAPQYYDPNTHIPYNADGTINMDAYKRQEYENLLEVLTCICVPIGALGFYFWVATLISTAVSIYKALQVGKDELGIMSMFVGIVTFVFSIFSVYTNSKTLRDCGEAGAFGAVRAATVISLLAAAANAIGSAVMTFWILMGEEWIRRARFIFQAAFSLVIIGGPAYYIAVALNIDYLRPADYQASGVGYGVMFVVLIPSIILGVFLLWVVVFAGRDGEDLPLGLGEEAFRSKWTLALLTTVVLVSLLFCAFGNVGMGKAVEDVWGKYILDKWVGKASAIYTGALPAVNGFFLLFG
ncbi:hypothetical protein DFH27DRAFT_560472 [Peziza echinospora]|nr:hypothetical protein DFH27DRAFT_560472 [Peziza echinospora]